jgi:hypothetical protein
MLLPVNRKYINYDLGVSDPASYSCPSSSSVLPLSEQMGFDTDTSRKMEQQLDAKHVSPHVAELDEVDVAAKLAAAADGSLDSATALCLRLVSSTPASYKVERADPLPQTEDRFAPHAFNV